MLHHRWTTGLEQASSDNKPHCWSSVEDTSTTSSQQDSKHASLSLNCRSGAGKFRQQTTLSRRHWRLRHCSFCNHSHQPGYNADNWWFVMWQHIIDLEFVIIGALLSLTESTSVKLGTTASQSWRSLIPRPAYGSSTHQTGSKEYLPTQITNTVNWHSDACWRQLKLANSAVWEDHSYHSTIAQHLQYSPMRPHSRPESGPSKSGPKG